MLEKKVQIWDDPFTLVVNNSLTNQDVITFRYDHFSFSHIQWTDEPPRNNAVGFAGSCVTNTNSAPPISNTPLCQCNLPSAPRTVKKEGPTFGKEFFVCSKPQNDPVRCDFFAWADASVNTAKCSFNGSTSFSNSYDPPEPAGGSGRVKCHCSLIAVLKTCRKEGANFDRQFYTCAKSGRQCKFFQWEDEPAGQSFASPSFNTNSGGSSSSSLSCFKCGQTGHFASSCTQAYNGTDENRGYSKNSSTSIMSCYKCGEPGHFANACPQASGPSSSSRGGKISKPKSIRGRKRGS